jgi:hypothetical protein
MQAIFLNCLARGELAMYWCFYLENTECILKRWGIGSSAFKKVMVDPPSVDETNTDT